MIHQSFIRRSTDFDGTSTPMLPEDISRRRPSSARSRESFFIPHIFRKETIKNKEEKKSDNSNVSKEKIKTETSNLTKNEEDKSNVYTKLRIPPTKGDQTSMTNVRSAFEENMDKRKSHSIINNE